MNWCKSPGVRQVLSAQQRVGIQQVALGYAKPPVSLQEPNRNTGPSYARVASAHVRGVVNTRKIVSHFLNNPLEHLGFFASRQRFQEPSDFLNRFLGIAS